MKRLSYPNYLVPVPFNFTFNGLAQVIVTMNTWTSTKDYDAHLMG